MSIPPDDDRIRGPLIPPVTPVQPIRLFISSQSSREFADLLRDSLADDEELAYGLIRASGQGAHHFLAWLEEHLETFAAEYDRQTSSPPVIRPNAAGLRSLRDRLQDALKDVERQISRGT